MGALHRLVDLLRKLDPENKRWEARQRARLAAEKTKAEDARRRGTPSRSPGRRQTARKPNSRRIFNVGRFDRDYARKLFLIENAIFGSDIQPVAVQIAKLRFFIALICDQKTDPRAPNQGVLPLPNLETRIVAANTLMPIPEILQDGHVADLFDSEIRRHRSQLQEVRHEHFAARHPATKRRCREKDAKIRQELSELLRREAHLPKKVAQILADWDPYDQNTFAPFFDPAWMFGDAYLRGAKAAEAGFDIVIGNPPYVRQEKDQGPEGRPQTALPGHLHRHRRPLRLFLRPCPPTPPARRHPVLHHLEQVVSRRLRRETPRPSRQDHHAAFTPLISATRPSSPPLLIPPSSSPARPRHRQTRLPRAQLGPGHTQHRNRQLRRLLCRQVRTCGPEQSDSQRAGGSGDEKREDLLERIRSVGTPLRRVREWTVVSGIKTGLNEAFVVDRATRDRLIAEDRSHRRSLLQTIYSGKDIKRLALSDADVAYPDSVL